MVSCPDYDSDKSLAVKQDKAYRVKKYKPEQFAGKYRRADLVATNKKSRFVPADNQQSVEIKKKGDVSQAKTHEGKTCTVQGEVNTVGIFINTKISMVAGKLVIPIIDKPHTSRKVIAGNSPEKMEKYAKPGYVEIPEKLCSADFPDYYSSATIKPAISSDKKVLRRSFLPNKTLATIAFVLALLVFIPFLGGLTFLPAVFFTGFSFFRYRKSDDKRGKGFAIASLILEALVTAFILAFLLAFYVFGEGY